MMQGLAGWQTLTGEPDGPPTKSGLSLVDLSGGYASAIALHGRDLARPPRGRRLRLRRLAVRDRAPRADVHRPLGSDARLRAAAPAELGPPVDRAVPELRDCGRLARRWRRRSRTPGTDLRRDRPARPERRRTLCDAGRPRRESRRAVASPRGGVPRRTADEWLETLVAAGVPASRVNTVEEALADPQTVAREDIVEHDHPTLGRVRSIRTPLRLAEAARASSGARARAAPWRAHRRGPRRALRLHAERVGSWRPRVSSETCDERARLRRLRAAPTRPAVARWRADRRQLRAQLRGGRREHSARRRRCIRGVPARGRRRTTDGRASQPQHRVDVRVRQPRRLLARAPHLHRARPAADRVRGRPGGGAESGRRPRHGRRRLGGRESWLALDRPRRHDRGRGAGAPPEGDRGDRAGVRPRPVGWYTGRVPSDPAARRRGGRLPLRLRLLLGRVALLGFRRGPRPSRDPYTLDANDFKFLQPNGFVTADDFLAYLVDSFDRLRAEGAGCCPSACTAASWPPGSCGGARQVPPPRT